MATYNLKNFQQSAIYQLNEAKGRVRLDGDWPAFRSECREICDHFLILSAASLLADMKLSQFFLNLCRAAENWRRYLIASRDYFNNPSPLAYNSPLFGAIIAEDQKILSDLLLAMPTVCQTGEEYAENFHETWLHLLLAANGYTVDESVLAHLAELEKVAEEPTRLDAFKALLGLDDLEESDFWMCFEINLFAYEEGVEQKVDSVTTSVTKFIAHRYLWLEGLAWLKGAQKKGFTQPSNAIKFCPDEALISMPEPYDGDWPLIPTP